MVEGVSTITNYATAKGAFILSPSPPRLVE